MINANGKRYLKGMNLSLSEYIKQSEQLGNSLLGAQCFAENTRTMNTDLSVPTLRVPMAMLGEVDSICTVWLGSGLPKSAQYEAINYRYDDNLLFGVIELSETMFDKNIDKTPLQQATEYAYSQIFSLLDKLSFPYLFRVWNYMADINDQSFGLERYAQFNLGRQDAFLSHGRDVLGKVPAACALGFKSALNDDNAPHNSLIISFLAGRVEPQYIENPRQVSAYQYPQQYGPRSPTFSRASLVMQGSDELLFLSGTASIVGHKTLHPNDVLAQTRETITNINAVLIELNSRDSQMKFDLSDLHYTVYVRRIEDLESIRNELKLCVGAKLNAVYLQANVCRQDLLLEIEATAGHSMVKRYSHLASKDLNNERAN
jgi:chorismate lyase/3-hydroxybenzoate synthase